MGERTGKRQVHVHTGLPHRRFGVAEHGGGPQKDFPGKGLRRERASFGSYIFCMARAVAVYGCCLALVVVGGLWVRCGGGSQV